ncbi:hypothetical protein GCM10017750_57660 [Streptomyces racemochromogenes]
MDAESLHHPEGPGDGTVGHVPKGVVGGLGVQGHEVPEGVVGALGLRDLPVRVGLSGVDDVGELDRVLDEEGTNTGVSTPFARNAALVTLPAVP